MATNFPNNLDLFQNPDASDTLDGSFVPHADQHANINDAMAAAQAKLGVDFSNVTTSLDYITNLLLATSLQHPAGTYREISGGFLPASITWYTDPSKTIKLVEKEYQYDTLTKILPSTIVLRLYDGTAFNTLVRTFTDTVTYNKVFEVSRTRTII
jgi:hypothetical protein